MILIIIFSDSGANNTVYCTLLFMCLFISLINQKSGELTENSFRVEI